MSIVLGGVNDQCDKLVMVVGHQFITLIVNICVQHGGPEAPHSAGPSAAAETILILCQIKIYITFSCLQCLPFSLHQLV